MQHYLQQRVSAERSFGRSLHFGGGAIRGEVFGKVFGLVLLGQSKQKSFSPKFPRLTDKISVKNVMTRFCTETPANTILKRLGQKSCRTKVSRIFRIFVPNFVPDFAPNFPPNFLRSFRASFRGKRRPEKIHQKSRPFFNAKFPGKFEEEIHKSSLESRQK